MADGGHRAQGELRPKPTCPVCDAEAGVPGACPEGFCYLCTVQWNGSSERASGAAEARDRFIARRKAELAGAEVKRAAKAKGDEAARLESEIQGDIVKALQELKRKRRVFYWRANAGGAWLGEQFVRANKSGTPDLVCCVRVERKRADSTAVVFGVFLGLEVKRPGEKQSPAQLKFEVDLRDQGGGFYSVVASAADAVAAVEAASQLRSWP